VENNPLLAINSARHHLPDLILLDVMMPERDGGRVLADLRSDLSLRYIPERNRPRGSQALADTGSIKSEILSMPDASAKDEPILNLPERDAGSFATPGPRADENFGAKGSSPDFSFPDRPGEDGSAENPW